MSTVPNESVERIAAAVARALAKGESVAPVLEREKSSGAPVVVLGALFGGLEGLKAALKAARGERLPQTDTFKIVDHWGRMTALASLAAEMAAKTESDGEAARARVETFWRGVTEAALNLTRDITVLGGLARFAELTESVLGTARAESEGVTGSIKRMVARG